VWCVGWEVGMVAGYEKRDSMEEERDGMEGRREKK
jgi:hypothetical protein